MNAIDGVEITAEKYRRARCKACKKKIMPLEIRGLVSGRYTGYLCEKHLKEEIKIIPVQLKEISQKLIKLSKMSNKEKRSQLERIKILNKLSI